MRNSPTAKAFWLLSRLCLERRQPVFPLKREMLLFTEEKILRIKIAAANNIETFSPTLKSEVSDRD